MKILLVNDCPPMMAGSGGVETHVRQLRDSLSDRGVTVAMLASQQRGSNEQCSDREWLISDFKAPPIRKHFVKNYTQHQAALKKADKMIRAFQPDVIHIHNLMDPGALHMLRLFGATVKSIHDCRPFCVKPYPVVASRLVGDSESFCDITFGTSCWKNCYARAGEGMLQRVESWSYFKPNLRALREIIKSDQLIVYSEYLKELALQKLHDESRIHLVPLFTDAEAASNVRFVKPVDVIPTFLYAGRLSPEKGVLKLFDALDRIPQVACKLVIAGDGPCRDEVLSRMQGCHPLHDVQLVGYLNQSQLYEQYRKAAVLLLPSMGSEGCSLSGIEAMFFSTPVIGFQVGGVGEWLIDGKTGISVDRGNVDAFALAMMDLVANPARREVLGHQARRFVQKKFNREGHINQLLTIYEQVLQPTGRMP